MNAQTFARLHQAQIRSGISITAFCRKRGLALSSFHYWRRWYGSNPTADGFVEVQLTEPPQPALPTPSEVVEMPIALFYRGAHLSLCPGFSPSALRKCLEVLK